jgi:hypothetical protein
MCEIRLQGPAEISRECTKRIMKFAREVALEEMLKGIPRHLVDVTSGENVLIRNHDSQCTVDTGIGVTPDIIELVKRLTRAEGLIPRDLLPPKEG